MYPIRYDRFGRMLYNPEFHTNTRKQWSKSDLDYLVDWYDKIGPEEMSFALERTMASVMQKVNSLRKQGIMPSSIKHIVHKRIKKEHSPKCSNTKTQLNCI